VVKNHWRLSAYLALMITLMMFLSHGTQDLYPDFLRSTRGASSQTVSYIAILYNIGAVAGAVLFGHLSESLGRRRAMVAALIWSLLAIPGWAFPPRILLAALAAFFLQAGVQGAWGIIPAHLNELSPDETRGLLPGLTYQLGVLIAAPVNTIEYWLRARFGYSWALAGFEAVNIALLVAVIALGSERKGRLFAPPDQ
jgi:MFS transporter, SHS family, lactate transporter